MNNMIYRPYASSIKTAMVLSKSDRSLMKLRSSRLIRYVCERKKWIEPLILPEFKHDADSEYYWNNGSVMLNFLIDYYYSMYLYCLKSSGEKCDFIDFNCEEIYRAHKAECSEDKWNLSQKKTHREFLLNSDRKWYGRFWREK